MEDLSELSGLNAPAEGEVRLKNLEKYGKIIIFCVLFAVSVFLLVTNLKNWIWLTPILAVLLLENAVKFWFLKKYSHKAICYALDTVSMLLLTYFSDGTLVSTFYIVILSEFYLGQPHVRGNLFMFAINTFSFVAVRAIATALYGQEVNGLTIIVNSLNDIILLSLHFLIFNFTIQIFRKNKAITKALDELHASNEKLQRAYRELQEITALEERQRIAKEIHDTAGHSITTVIMQTEAARLILESDPQEAKRRISAANLQAKHALEELRESVHLLSGSGQDASLKERLLTIIHESTDGTDIAIRSDIDDVTLCEAKSRFLCNSLKEGVSNGLRHGGATAFYFELKREKGRIKFLLSDNGRGEEQSALIEGFGLTGMRSRAESLGGQLFVQTEIDEGFEITITLPEDGERKGDRTNED